MANQYDFLGGVQQGQNWIDGLFQQQAKRQAGAALASGNTQGAAQTLYRAGDLAGGRQVTQNAAADATAAQAARTADSARQLQTTLQVVKALKSQRDAGQDVSAALPQYRATFLAMGTRPEDFDQIAAQIAQNPAFLDQIEELTAQQMKYELRAGADGDTVAIGLNPETGQTSSNVAYQAPRTPTRVAVGNDYIEVGADGNVTPLYQGAKAPEYRSVRNSDGTETIVELGGRPGGVVGGGATPAPSGGSGVPRGIRNNNPGNIEDGAFAKSLPGYAGSDGRFAIFNDLASGEGAQTRLLGSYVQRGFDTPAKIINRWAPPSDNNPTGAYVSYVANRAGLGPNDRVTEDKIPLIAQAIREFENGSRSASNGAPSATPAATGGARVVAQGQNNGLSQAERNAEQRFARQDRSDSRQLRKDFESQDGVKEYETVRSAYNRLQALTRSGTATDDTAVGFEFMKMLDPTSVVRESEYALVGQSQGIGGQALVALQRLSTGQRLTPELRRNLVDTAGRVFEGRQQRYNELVNQYRGYAEEDGFDPNRVVPLRGPNGQRQRQTNAPGIPFNVSPQQLQARQRLVGTGANPSSPVGSPLNPRYVNPADERGSLANIREGEYYVNPQGEVLRRGPRRR